MKIFFLLAVCLLLTASVFAQGDMHKVDFKNFTYSAHCLGDRPSKITVKDGEFSQEKQEDGYVDRFSFSIMDIAFGDLNGDKQDEAIVLSICNTGGTGNFSEGFIYSMRAGKASQVGRIPGGDRGYGGLRSTRVENGMLLVDSNDAGTEGAACCPQYIVTTKYRLGPRGGILKVGKSERRELYPKERVTFAKGMSSKTFETTIRAEEGKRFIVGAGSGQTMTVSIDTDKASVRLLEEEAEVKHGTNSFVAKLQKSGDYTIEVQNDSDAPLTLIVTIKIK